jgi:hypothetical protein
MEILDAVQAPAGTSAAGAVPTDAQIVISVLNGEAGPAIERRRFVRTTYQTPGAIESIGEPIPRCWTIYTRDANQWGVGFVTQEPLPVAKDVILHVAAAGQVLSLRGCIVRLREVMPGWYDGAVLLGEEEPRLAL